MFRAATGNTDVNISITIDDREITLRFPKWARRLEDLRRFWTDFFAPQFFIDVQRNFNTEGSFVGGWRALSPRYAAWKLRHYGRKPILVRTGRMKRSFVYGGPGNYIRAWKLRMALGSTVEYTKYHQAGTERMPARPVIWLGQQRVYQKLLTQFVREEGRAEGVA